MHLPETWLGVLALVVLAFAVAGGALTAFMLLTDRNPPLDLGLVHGRAGVAGILVLAIAAMLGVETGARVWAALVLLALTVAGGAMLYFFIRRKGILSGAMILGHGALAVAALATLLFA